MKKILISVITVGLLMLPLTVYARSEQTIKEAPPVAQALIREGDFAIKLADTLKIGITKSEVEAETLLGSSGIAPRNGWIADYPVTPDIIGELEKSIGEAADAKRLPMGKKEALEAFRTTVAELGLPIMAEVPDRYVESPSPTTPQYTEPPVINNYYYNEGPPVVSYYPPPWDYYYMYAWVPYPFWWGGFFFPGFFCLHDFHRAVFVGGHGAFVSNHVTDPVSREVFRVDPNGRRTGETFKTATISSNRGFNTSEARNGAASIFNRGVERSRSSNMATTMGKGFTNGSNSWSQSSGRSFSAPNRSFSGSSSGSSSFSCANCHGGSNSFGHSGGSSSRSFSGGGFSSGSHGGGFGGFQGGGGGGHR